MSLNVQIHCSDERNQHQNSHLFTARERVLSRLGSCHLNISHKKVKFNSGISREIIAPKPMSQAIQALRNPTIFVCPLSATFSLDHQDQIHYHSHLNFHDSNNQESKTQYLVYLPCGFDIPVLHSTTILSLIRQHSRV